MIEKIGKSPFAEALLQSPMSVVNAILIVLGGASVWYTQQSELQRLQDQVARQDRTIAKLELRIDADQSRVAQDVLAIKLSVTRMETRMEFVAKRLGEPTRPR